MNGEWSMINDESLKMIINSLPKNKNKVEDNCDGDRLW